MIKLPKSFTWAVLAVTALCVGLSSCIGGEDDEEDVDMPNLWQGSLSDAKYEDDAVFYEVINSDIISSIELTASGNYIIMPKSVPNYTPATRVGTKAGIAGMFHSKNTTRYDDYESAVFGTYTKESDGSYNLRDFGVLTPLNNDRISLKMIAGSELTLNVIRKNLIDSNPLNNRLCRTWHLEEVYEDLYDHKGNIIKSKKLNHSEIEDEYVEYVIVTKAGTFTQIDWDNTLDSYGTWWWEDASEQIFGYSFVDEDSYGSEGVTFDGDYATFYETATGSYDDFIDNDDDYDARYDSYVTLQIRVVCKAQ